MIGNFKGGKAHVEMKFKPDKGKSSKYYHLLYLSPNGKTTYKNGRLGSDLDHFSEYAIVYDKRVNNKKPDEPAPVKPKKATVKAPFLAKMTANGKKSLDISWTKVKGAAGYDVYLSRCNYDNKVMVVKKVKTLKGNGATAWSAKNLKKKTACKGIIKAYVMKNGKKSYISSSQSFHAFTSGGSKHYTNPKSVTVKKAKVTLAKGKTFQIKATVKKLKKGKKLINQKHTARLRYYSSNKKIVTVSKSGKIKAKAKGSCKIYAVAANGVRTTVSVTVK